MKADPSVHAVDSSASQDTGVLCPTRLPVALCGSLPASSEFPPPVPRVAVQHVLCALTPFGLISRQLWAGLPCLGLLAALGQLCFKVFLFLLMTWDCLCSGGTAQELWFPPPPVSHSCFSQRRSKSLILADLCFVLGWFPTLSNCTALTHSLTLMEGRGISENARGSRRWAAWAHFGGRANKSLTCLELWIPYLRKSKEKFLCFRVPYCAGHRASRDRGEH